jgi:hypothetical protein
VVWSAAAAGGEGFCSRTRRLVGPAALAGSGCCCSACAANWSGPRVVGLLCGGGRRRQGTGGGFSSGSSVETSLAGGCRLVLSGPVAPSLPW